MLVSYDEQLWFVQHFTRETIPASKLLGEVPAGMDRHVHLTGQFVLSTSNERRHVGKAHVPDNHQVDVAGGFLLAAGHRPVDEGPQDTVLKGLERLPEHVHQPRSLQDKPPKLGQEWAVFIGLKVDTVSIFPPAKDPGFDQGADFALQAGGANPQVLSQAGEVPGAVLVAQDHRQDSLTGSGEQGIERA
jgi:hypothetical protein